MKQSNEVIYQEITPLEYPRLKEMIINAFGFSRFSKNRVVINSLAEIYLRATILMSTYHQVAIKEGRAIGFLYGRLDGERYLANRWGHRLVIVVHVIIATLLSMFSLPTALQALKYDQTYQALKAMCQKKFIAEVTGLIVTSESRGLGVGKRLYSDFVDYLDERGATSFFLFTDSALSYGFYEKQGMIREATIPVTFYIKPTPETLEIYLYSRSVQTDASIQTWKFDEYSS